MLHTHEVTGSSPVVSTKRISVTVAHRTLTPFAGVRIPHPLPEKANRFCDWLFCCPEEFPSKRCPMRPRRLPEKAGRPVYQICKAKTQTNRPCTSRNPGSTGPILSFFGKIQFSLYTSESLCHFLNGSLWWSECMGSDTLSQKRT